MKFFSIFSILLIQIIDTAELIFPKIGFIKFHDAENGHSSWLDTSNKSIHNKITNNINDKNNDISVFCNKNNIDLISINTSKGYLEPLIDFFNYRMQKY